MPFIRAPKGLGGAPRAREPAFGVLVPFRSFPAHLSGSPER
jgi:hypothetical protein